MAETVLGNRYRLLEQVGEGGMAVVYRAEDTLLGRQVAVKILRPQYAADPDFLARFRREAQAAAGLLHPNIVNVFDVGMDLPARPDASPDGAEPASTGQSYIVMEFVPGNTLKEIILQRAPLPVSEALDLVSQVCAAVDFAHRKGLIHRDVKPHNVLVNADGLAKVADFGLAAAQGEGAEGMGTAHYLSPEQAQGNPAGPASDVYSIGIMLYECVTGKLPFDGATVDEVVLKQIQESPVPPHLLNDRLPVTVEGFILRAMAKDPAERYASARELGSALQAYRHMGEGRTMPYRPAGQAQPPAAGAQEVASPAPAGAEGTPDRTKAGENRSAIARPAATVSATPAARPRSGGFDCLLVTLLLATVVCLLGLIPLGMMVRDSLSVPTPTPLPEVVVPNLVGLEPGQAEATLLALGLTMVQQGERFDDKIPAGRVAAQTIPSNTSIQWGEEVGVLLSRGVELVSAPNVVGLPFADAQDRLNRAGLAAYRQEAASRLVAAGLVISQLPDSAVAVRRGTVVTLTVSLGNKVTVPDLMAKTEAEAQQLIMDTGLATTYANYQAPEDVPPAEKWRLDRVKVGAVLSQTPAAGSVVERGTTVYLAVRKR